MQTTRAKRVLIITYYWPPAGGPGVQRWLGFVSHLNEFSIEPVVYIPSNPNYPITDSSLLHKVPQNLRVLRHPIKEPYKAASILSKARSKEISKGIIPAKSKQSFIEKLLLFVRGNFFIPDARKSWIKPSIEFLEKKIGELQIETVITTGPPHSLHLIGKGLKENLGVKWIADFRDPWTTIGYHKDLKLMSWAKKKHQVLEIEVLNKADQIVVTSFSTKSEFEQKTSTPITVITNGFSYLDIDVEKKDEKFTMAHIGSLLSKRNPKILWQILQELVSDHKDFSEDFKLKLIGTTSQDVVDSIKDLGLENHLEIIPYVEHQEALKYQQRSRVLLLIEIDSEDTRAIVPGKLFEYLRSGTPILAIGPNNWDVEKIVQHTESGFYFDYESKEELKKCILNFYNFYLNGDKVIEPRNIDQYSRRNLTKKLAELI